MKLTSTPPMPAMAPRFGKVIIAPQQLLSPHTDNQKEFGLAITLTDKDAALSPFPKSAIGDTLHLVARLGDKKDIESLHAEFPIKDSYDSTRVARVEIQRGMFGQLAERFLSGTTASALLHDQTDKLFPRVTFSPGRTADDHTKNEAVRVLKEKVKGLIYWNSSTHHVKPQPAYYLR